MMAVHSESEGVGWLAVHFYRGDKKKVKMNLFLCLIKHHVLKRYGRVEFIASHSQSLHQMKVKSQLRSPAALHPISGSRWIGGWMSHRAAWTPCREEKDL
jgi:hypothetical protein